MDRAASERELLRACLAGDKEAFGVIVQRYQSLVCAIAYSAIGDVGRSEELAQETFLRAWKGLRQLEDLGRFRAWLCTIARHLVSRSARERSRDVLHAADSLERAETVAATTPGPGQVAIDKEVQAIVWAAVGRVPDEYREPLVLFYRQQQSISQVAADLGLSEETVRQRLCRGRQFIRAEVASLVEDALGRSGPGKAFAVAVVAALPAIVTPTASAAAVGVAAKGTPAAKTALAAGLSGAILGPVLGMLGAVLGTWCSIRNTESPRERRFMIRTTLLFWLLIFVLVGLPLTLALTGLMSKAVFWSCVAAFFILLLPLALWSNARQRQIRIQDGTFHACGRPRARTTNPSFAGGIFGAVIWVLIVAGMTDDWITAFVVLLLALLVFLTSRRLSATQPERPLLAQLVALLGVGAIDLGVVCLRWRAWQQVEAFNRVGGAAPLWFVVVLLAAFVAVMAAGLIVVDRRRSTAAMRPPDIWTITRSGIYGSFAGAVFGSVGWLFMMSLVAGDWIAVAVALYAVVVFIISVRACIAQPRRRWPILLIDVAALYLLHLLVLNLRWSRWMASAAGAGHLSAYREIPLIRVNVIITGLAMAMALIFILRWAAERRLREMER